MGGGVPQGGGRVRKICTEGQGEGGPIRVCLFQTLLGRKPRRILISTTTLRMFVKNPPGVTDVEARLGIRENPVLLTVLCPPPLTEGGVRDGKSLFRVVLATSGTCLK